MFSLSDFYCQTPVLGLWLAVDFAFAWDNKNNNKNDKNNNKNPHLSFSKGALLGLKDKEQGVGVMDKGQRIRGKVQGSKDKG